MNKLVGVENKNITPFSRINFRFLSNRLDWRSKLCWGFFSKTLIISYCQYENQWELLDVYHIT